MKTSLILASVTAMVAPYLMAPAALAFQGPTDAYLAEYEIVSPKGKFYMNIASDGKGMAVMKTNNEGREVYTFSDYNAGVITKVDVTHKAALKNKMTASDESNYKMDVIRKAASKELGSKVVEGHPCKGYEQKNGDNTGQIWIGDDCNLIVLSEATESTGKTTLTLKKNTDKPDPSLFIIEIPKDYQLYDENKIQEKK